MKNIETYEEYEKLFTDDLVIAVRALLNRIEDKGAYDIEDSREHNALKRYFNTFGLHKKITEEQFKTWNH